jgi:hypothetical protein
MQNQEAHAPFRSEISPMAGLTRVFLAVDPAVPESGSLIDTFRSARRVGSETGGTKSTTDDFDLTADVECVDLASDEQSKRIDQALSSDLSARLVVIYPNPLLVVASQLSCAEAEADPTAAWSQHVGRLLGLFRRHRRQVVLAVGHAALWNG